MALSDIAAQAVRLQPDEPGYPAPLRTLADAPVLRVAGALPAWDRAVAIVGTRRATSEACAWAKRLALELGRAGCVIVSGGAHGIDAAAHQGALKAGAPTVVVLGSPIANAYPRAHHPLFREVLARGCLLTTHDEEGATFRASFAQRNRWIAALSQAVVVGQAPLGSGALITAAQARKRTIKRTVLAMPTTPWDELGAGGLQLLTEGALVCTGSADVLRLPALGGGQLGLPSLENEEEAHDLSHLCETDRTILQAFCGQTLHPDSIAQRQGFAVSVVQQSMLRLLLEGLVEEASGGRYRSCIRGTGT